VLGTLVVGALIGRVSAQRALRLLLVGAGVAIATMGVMAGQVASFASVAILAGCCASAAGGAMLAVSASLYAPQMRATAVGWALGIGRIGTVLGPSAVGLLANGGWPIAAIYALIGGVAVLGALFVHFLGIVARPRPATS